MQLPEKVQTAIATLAPFDMAVDRVAPFVYRQFLRLRPATPPPLWGASPAYWRILALVTAMFWGTLAMLVVGYLTWPDSAGSEPAHWGPFLLWQCLVWSAAALLGWTVAGEQRRGAASEAAVLGLPAWEHFHPLWRPSLENLRQRAQPVHYWLRSLWNDPIVKLAATVGALVFVVVALAFPLKAGNYAQTLASSYVYIAFTGFARTYKRRPLPSRLICGQRALGWRCANGFWAGSIFASVFWQVVLAPAMHYPVGEHTLFFAVAALALHASESFTFNQESSLALRAERAEQSRQLAEVRLQMLKNQIEPHFIFNALAHLKALIKSKPEIAERMADELSDFLRASLRSLREDRVTVAQDFELVRAYLALARLRMGERLQVDLHCDPDAAAQQIPPLMLQTLVENAVQHGIEPQAGTGRITVSATIDRSATPPHLALSVSDDGAGFAANNSSGSGLGLVNIRERLASAYGAQAKLTLSANTPHGVIATLLLPIQIPA